jgi:hypothetical protein
MRTSTHGLKVGTRIKVGGMGRKGRGTITQFVQCLDGPQLVRYRADYNKAEYLVSLNRVSRIDGPRVPKDNGDHLTEHDTMVSGPKEGPG